MSSSIADRRVPSNVDTGRHFIAYVHISIKQDVDTVAMGIYVNALVNTLNSCSHSSVSKDGWRLFCVCVCVCVCQHRRVE